MTPGSAQIGPLRAFTLAARDLRAINDRLETMHTEAWHPAGPNRDRPTPHRDPASHPDHVKGSTWDCGLGDERARQAWTKMVWHLRNAEQVSADILRALRGLERRSVASYAPTGLVDARDGVARLSVTLTALQRFYVAWSSDDGAAVDVPRAQWLARQLMGERGRPQGSCFAEIEQAMFCAQRIVREVGNGQPPAACPKCRRIGNGQPREGGLCQACYQKGHRYDRCVRCHRIGAITSGTKERLCEVCRMSMLRVGRRKRQATARAMSS